MDKILRTVQDIASSCYDVPRNITRLHMIAGFCQILSWDEYVAELYFNSQYEKETIRELRRRAFELDIHVDEIDFAATGIFSWYEIEDEIPSSSLTEDFLFDRQYDYNDSSLIVWEKLITGCDELYLLCGNHRYLEVISHLLNKDENTDIVKDEEKPEFDVDYNEYKNMDMAIENRFYSCIYSAQTIQDKLNKAVFGQPEAIRKVTQRFFGDFIPYKSGKDRSLGGKMFFVGPPGVGKTYTALELARLSKFPYMCLSMGDYCKAESIDEIFGNADITKNSKMGILTQFVRESGRCIVIFDEIDKAADEVVYQIIKILDTGEYIDRNFDFTVNFSETMFIFTTGIGKTLYDNRSDKLSDLRGSSIKKALLDDKDITENNLIPKELINRISGTEFVPFNYLETDDLMKIIKKELLHVQSTLGEKYIKLDFADDKNILSFMMYGHSDMIDARRVTTESVNTIKDEVFEFGRQIYAQIEDFTEDRQPISKVVFGVDLDNEDDSIRELFESDLPIDFAYFGDESLFADIGDNARIRPHVVKNYEQFENCVAKNDISFVIIDPFFCTIVDEDKYLSLDDLRSEGILAFEKIKEKLPQLPIYMYDKTASVSSKDMAVLCEKGVKDFIRFSEEEGDEKNFIEYITDIAQFLYCKERIEQLSGRGRVLTYNTKQNIVNDESGNTVYVDFYGFGTKMVIDSGDADLILKQQEKPKDRMADVIGAESAKEEMMYFVDYMKNPKKYMVKNIKPPKGILLYGPPGTGKTMLARAMAGESDVSFFPTTATAFQDKYWGESERKIRDMFSIARKYAPSIIFIDEVDAIAKERTGSDDGQAYESMLNTLLTEMDGFDVNPSKPVFVVAATNYDVDETDSTKKRTLDQAFVRRFDNKIYVDLPDESEREKYLNILLKDIEDKDITETAIHNIASRTTGQSLAIIKNIIGLMERNCSRKQIKPNDDELLGALEEYMYGEKKEWSEPYYKAVSIHESGHAYICALSGKKPSYITIVSRGNYGGYMQRESEENTPSFTREELLWKIRTALAGRVAEEEFFGEEGINTGISSDLQQASTIAINMICKYGMDGDRLFSVDPSVYLNSSYGGSLMDRAEEILREQMSVTRELVRKGRDKIKDLSEFLLKHNQATDVQIQSILNI